MLKVALISATMLAAASASMATTIDVESGVAPAGDTSCRLVQSMDLGCALRIVDANDDSAMPAAELAYLAAPARAVDWAPLHPPLATGLDFKDAAIEPGSVLPATPDRDTSHPLVPALFALGAMVVLLRRRPN